MDINGLGTAGVPYNGTFAAGIPAGYGMMLAGNGAFANGYAGLTESQKEEIILRCKAADSREEMQEIVDTLAPGVDVREVYEEEKESFS